MKVAGPARVSEGRWRGGILGGGCWRADDAAVMTKWLLWAGPLGRCDSGGALPARGTYAMVQVCVQRLVHDSGTTVQAPNLRGIHQRANTCQISPRKWAARDSAERHKLDPVDLKTV